MDDRKDKTILLVEDEVIIAMTEQVALEKYHYKVMLAHSGEQAIEMASTFPEIDLILMDINLGRGMNGTEAAAQILKSRHIPVVFLSSHTSKDIVEMTEKITSYGYVVKDSGITVLDASIKMAFKLFEANEKFRQELAERKRTEVELQETLQTSADIVAAIPSGLFIYQFKAPNQLFLISGNPEAERLTGIISEEWKGREFNEIWPKARSLGITDHYLTTMRTGVTFETEDLYYEDKRLSGAFRIRAFALPENRLAVAFENITELKKVEKALKESAEEFHQLTENIREVFWLGSTDWSEVFYISPAYEEIWGRSRAELYAHPLSWLDSIVAEDRPQVLAVIQARDENEFAPAIFPEYRIIRPDGSQRWIAARGFPVLDAAGQVYRIAGLAEDITARKAAEEQLRESEERFHALFERAPLGYQSLDSYGNLVEVNQAWLETFGYSREEVIGKWFGDFLAPEYVPTFQECFSTFKTRGSVQSEFYMLHKNGDRRYITFEGRVRHNTDGSFKQTHCILKDETERKHAEEARRESEERYRQLVDISPDLVAVHQEGKIVFINTSGAQLLGAANPEQIIGKAITEFLPPDRVDITKERVSKLFEVGRAPLYEERLRRLDGTDVDAEVTGVAFLYNGKPAVQMIARDITERKQAEETLRENQAMLRQILDTVPQYIFWKDTNSVYLGCNQAFAQVCNLNDPEQIVGTTDFELPWSRAEAETFRTDDAQVIRSGVPKRHIIEPLRHADGTGGWAETTKLPLLDAQHEVRGVLGVYDDITERKRAEEALRESERRFASAFDYAAIGMALVSPEGRWLKVNHAVCELVGYTETELLERTFQDITHPDDLETDLNYVQQMLAGTIRTYQMEKRYYHKAGHIVWVLLSVSLVRDEEGKPLHFISQIEDITERKQAEEVIRQQVREKEILLKEVHHRIKNNITSIEALLSLQALSIDTPEAVSALQDAISRVGSMRVLYETLLLSDEYRVLSTRPYLEALTNAVIAIFPDTASITLSTQIDDFPMSTKYLFAVGIVVNELLTNAMKYAFVGRATGSLRVTFTQTAQRVTLIVQDDGPGFSTDTNGDPAHSFGLRIIQMLCKQVAGDFTIEQENGTKCIFAFDL